MKSIFKLSHFSALIVLSFIPAIANSGNNHLYTLPHSGASVNTLYEKRRFDFAGEVTIVTAVKKYDRSAPFWGEYMARCTQWSLTKADIKRIILAKKKITKFDFQYFYDVLPCSYRGVVVINSKRYNFEINPGSFLVLERMNRFLYYDCSDKKVANYFLTTPATPETMNEK
jgi:hypothetical protein